MPAARVPYRQDYSMPKPQIPQPGIGEGVPLSYAQQYQQQTLQGLGSIQEQYSAAAMAASGSGAAAARAAKDRLRFGLQEIGLQREGLELTRQETAIGQRNRMEAVINNALQRGIYQSGIRIRNQERAGEIAEIEEARLDLSERGLALDEQQLRASIKNALAAIAEQRRNARAQANLQMARAIEEYEQYRRQYFDELQFQYGSTYDDTPIPPNPADRGGLL